MTVIGMYPSWAIFVCPWSKGAVIRDRTGKKKHFNSKQEGRRKDVERFCSVLAEECGVLQKPLRNWHIEDISVIVKCCVILHNMNVRTAAWALRRENKHRLMSGDVESRQKSQICFGERRIESLMTGDSTTSG